VPLEGGVVTKEAYSCSATTRKQHSDTSDARKEGWNTSHSHVKWVVLYVALVRQRNLRRAKRATDHSIKLTQHREHERHHKQQQADVPQGGQGQQQGVEQDPQGPSATDEPQHSGHSQQADHVHPDAHTHT
jgi:hypothetical protein